MKCDPATYFAGEKPLDDKSAAYSGSDPYLQKEAEAAKCRIAGQRILDKLLTILTARNERVVVWNRPLPDPWPPDPWFWGRFGSGLQPEPPTLPDAIVVEALEAYAGLLEVLAKDFRTEAATRVNGPSASLSDSGRDGVTAGHRSD